MCKKLYNLTIIKLLFSILFKMLMLYDMSTQFKQQSDYYININ